MEEKNKKKPKFSTIASLFAGGVWKIPNISRKKLLERKIRQEKRENIPSLKKITKNPKKS